MKKTALILIIASLCSISAQSSGKISYRKLIALTEFAAQHRVYSIIASRNGKEFYRYLAPTLSGEEAHYLMSVTKSVLAVCTAAAVEEGKISSWRSTLGEILPDPAFSASSYREIQKKITLEQVFMMSGIHFAHVTNPDTLSTDERERWNRFMAPEAVRLPVLLGEPPVAQPGVTFHYNDHNAMLAAALLQHAVKEDAETYCARKIFKPLGFKNYEWMHRDAGGYTMGGYGLRLRPVDLHQLGIMLTHQGMLRGQPVLKPASVAQLWRRRITTGEWDWKNYSQFFWHSYPKAPWGERVEANGWMGQRLYIFPETQLVVSITGWLKENESVITEKILNDFLLTALDSAEGTAVSLKAALEKASRRKPFWNPADKTERMVPTVSRKEGVPVKLSWP